MINLLPPEEKRQLRAARSNTLLIRYNILLLGVVAFMGISIAVTYVFLSASQQTAKQTIAENDAKVKQFNPIKEQAELFRQHLTTAKQILDNEITYSKAVVAIACCTGWNFKFKILVRAIGCVNPYIVINPCCS